ncbi:MAG: glutamyl-tRNA reductase [Nitrosopumilaceae archaeon]
MSGKNFDIINARVTFKNLPIYKIESFSFKDLKVASETFMKISDVSECIIIQNPFRVEVFMVVNLEKGDAPDARRSEGKSLTINQIQKTWESLTELNEYDLDHLDQTLEVYRNNDVYLHLLRLATGLESLVIGRPEILDEIKKSVSNAQANKTSGKVLNKLFENIIRIATNIRDSTGISKGTISLGNIAVKTVADKAGIQGKKVLLIGTGETASLVARSLDSLGHEFDITSLTIERATSFSKNLGGKPVEFEEVLAGFDKYDIVFVATTADYFLINYDRLKMVMENKKNGTLILDISEPRAVDEKISKFPGLKLMFRDQVAELYEEDVKARAGKVPAVEEMIIKEVPIIEATMKRLDAEPIVKDVAISVDSLRKKELEKALEKLGEIDENKIKIIEELTKNVVEKIVSVPTNNTKKAPEKENQ